MHLHFVISEGVAMSVARAMPDKCGLDRTRAIPQQTSPPGLLDDRLGLAQSFLEGRNPTALRRRVIKASNSLIVCII